MRPVFLIVLITLGFVGCATPEKKPSTIELTRPSATATIDYVALQQELGIVASVGQVGFQEKHFDACNLSSHLPSLRDCRRAYFVLIQFQLSCRDSEQPNSVLSASELRPLTDHKLKWQVGTLSGKIRTDPQGYGEIRLISQASAKKQRLRISTGRDFLVMSAGQATNVVTPPSWCD